MGVGEDCRYRKKFENLNVKMPKMKLRYEGGDEAELGSRNECERERE